ncbi:hypothetical protein JYU34_010865 [Plutella xylostella]|uniref:Uncharacterized protein n=1 Tax=Plutella xylostella TaxID=51655 RepID=A0ABQ7QGP8_PLUXY|nr:hypothetical protein JYU34_010865 [Plutella xylostella]
MDTNLDSPGAGDVEKYLVSITRGLAYFLDVNVSGNGDKLSIMMLFFILKANLKHTLQHGVSIAEDDRRYVEKVIEIADRLIAVYGNQLNTEDDDDWKLASLMEHDIVIMKTLKLFNTNISSSSDAGSNLDSLERRWNNSCDYLNQGIVNLDHDKYNLSLQCKIFFIGIATFVKGCSLTANDSLVLSAHCAQAHAESEYLVKNSVDLQLFTLYVTFCSMAGESQFFRRSWFEKVLSLQTEDGSFSGAIDKNHRQCALGHILKVYPEGSTSTGEHLMQWDSEQFSASAVAALAAAVRFVLEPRRKGSIVINYSYVPHL